MVSTEATKVPLLYLLDELYPNGPVNLDLSKWAFSALDQEPPTTSLDSKWSAVAKLEVLVTIWQHPAPKCSNRY